MRFYTLLISLFFIGITFAQKATISGAITDLSYNNEPLPAVSISVKGTTIGTLADVNGKYSLEVNPGTHTIVYSFIGYITKEVQVVVKPSEKKVINQALDSDSITIENIVITAVQSREKESALLYEQQKSVEIKQNIGAQELSRKGVGDVATAVTKTSGISKQEGSGSVFVRGLGDRYNSSSMNGLPIPSNDPEKKNIALDIFSTDIVEYISIDKSYSTKMYGDFAGGNVDISSKNYTGEGLLEISLGSKINSNAVERGSDFSLQRGPNYFGFSNYGIPSNPLSQFNYQNSLNPDKESPYGGNFGLKAGKSFELGQEGKLNLFTTLNFDNGFEYRKGISQSLNAQGAKIKSFEQERHSYKTNTTGMFNANYRVNQNNKISYNFLFINSSDQNNDSFFGYDRDYGENNNHLVQRGTYTENIVMINQLLGSHSLSEKLSFDWAGSFNNVKSDMPDRTQNKFFSLENGLGYNLAQRTPTDNHRYFQNLNEDELAANLALSYKINTNENGESKGKVSVGYNVRMKKRDFEAIQFNFRIANEQLESVVNPNNLDQFFNQQNMDQNYFTIGSFAGLNPQTYGGEQNIHAGFINLEYKLTDKLSSVIGFRYEKIEQTVNWRTQLDASGSSNSFNRNEFLPNLILKYEANEKNNIRLATSKTYTLPQFKERALFLYEDVTEIKFGNPYLYPSENYNLDLKWEMFPKDEEIVSVTLFGKYIKNPINEITIASSTNDISYVNIGNQGHVYGIEFEARKNILNFGSDLENKLSAGANISFLQTKQDIDEKKVRDETNGNMSISLTDKSSGFTGASDLLLNADISYLKEFNNDKSINATLAYSYYSDRLYALGTDGKGNLVDKGMGTLDFILKTKINKNFGIDLAAKNILNPTFKRVQENNTTDLDVVSYKRGAFFSLGMNYSF